MEQESLLGKSFDDIEEADNHRRDNKALIEMLEKQDEEATGAPIIETPTNDHTGTGRIYPDIAGNIGVTGNTGVTGITGEAEVVGPTNEITAAEVRTAPTNGNAFLEFIERRRSEDARLRAAILRGRNG